MADHKKEDHEAVEKANAKHDMELAQKAADKKAAEDKAAAQLASERRAAEQQMADQRAADQRAKQQEDNARRVAESEELAARDPNTYEDPSYQQSEEAKHQADVQRQGKNAPHAPQRPVVTAESKPAPISEQTKLEMEAGKKAVAEAAKAAAEAEKLAAKEAKKAE